MYGSGGVDVEPYALAGFALISGVYAPYYIPDEYTPVGAGYNVQFSTQYSTRFTNLAFTSSSTDVVLDASYFIDEAEATSTRADRNPTLVSAKFSKVPTQTFEAVSYEIEDAVSPTWGYGTTTSVLDLDPSSTYDIVVQFANQGTPITGVYPFPLAYVSVTVSTDALGGVSTSSAPRFYDAVKAQAFEYQPCSLTEFGGCITNSLMYLFIPSNEDLEQFQTIKETLTQRVPFVYAFQIEEYWGYMFSTNNTHSLSVSATTSIGTINFISEAQLNALPMSGLVRSVVGYLLWVMLAFTLYARARSLFTPKDSV